MVTANNPLRKHFRQPAIHLRLPSGGKFYPQGTLILPPNGEVPILPMTAVDEITSRTPDALFNGSAVMEIIGSCVPNIRDPWAVPAVDINALLIAVRLASYGHELDISSRCPNCGTDHTFTVDLRMALDALQAPDYEQTVTIGDLTLSFTPMNYRQINENSRVQFEDQKIIQLLSNAETADDEKIAKLGEAFKRITRMTIKAIADSVSSISSADMLVTERGHIEEFMYNCPKGTFETIKNHVVALREATELKPISVTCDNCGHQYSQPFSLDMSNFFVTAS